MGKKRVKKKDWLNFKNLMYFLIILIVISIVKVSITSKPDLIKDAEIILTKLTDESASVGFLISNELIEEKIQDLDDMDYLEMKSALGVDSNFCIYFEDTNGNLVQIGETDIGIGSDKIFLNGLPCG